MPKAIRYERDGHCPFDEWLEKGLTRQDRNKVLGKVTLLEAGNFNNCKPVGEGVHERKFGGKGPGLRLYFAMDGETVIVLLCGGDKSSQDQDIKAAKECWSDYKERKAKEGSEQQ